MKKRSRFGWLTLSTSSIAAVLWVAAGTIAVRTGDFFSYIIVGILAGLANMVAVESARKDGFVQGEAHGALKLVAGKDSDAEE